LKRGFKTQAERVAGELRSQLGLAGAEPLCPWRLAEHLAICVFEITELPVPANDLAHLTGTGSSHWSGFSLRESGLVGVVLNSSHTKPRRRSTLMHEISHIYLGHSGSQVTLLGGTLLISDFSKEQEEEADWLMGALLLPRDALLHARARSLTNAQICEKYRASEEMCTWRLRMTGVDLQMRRRGTR
jgi:Zn-dependent peptidase ImmA (M78 family)